MFIWLRHAFSLRCYRQYKKRLFNKDERLQTKIDREREQAERFVQLSENIKNLKETVENRNKSTKDRIDELFYTTFEEIKDLKINTYQKLRDTKVDLEKNIQNSKQETMERIKHSQNALEGDLEKNKTIIDKIEKIFYGSKTYGTSGEMYLQTIIEEVLGTENKKFLLWKKQFQINNDLVDFVIYHPTLNDKYIPIDSKFPLTILNDDHKRSEKISRIKKMINDIKNKYVLNNKNCVGFAFMFIPSESIYNELLANYQELFTYGNKNKVYITSPTNILATISLFIEGTRDVYLSKNLKKVAKEISLLGGEYERLNKRWIVHKNYFDKIVTSIENIDTTFKKIHTKSLLIQQKSDKIEDEKIKNEQKRIAKTDKN